LTNLRGLYLQENKISAVPIEITKLTNLWYLWLNYNEIVDVHELLLGIFNMTELTELFLNNNKIESIPIKFNKGPELRMLSLQNNLME
jgi:Leucine-rich repeat (LRR) protein